MWGFHCPCSLPSQECKCSVWTWIKPRWTPSPRAKVTLAQGDTAVDEINDVDAGEQLVDKLGGILPAMG